jgi:hypothetical protein
MHCLPVLIAASVVLTGAASHALAQEPSRPTLTIARFEGTLKSSQTKDAGADLADTIAIRVEESGCCRVMLRAFLPQAAPGQSPLLEAIREAAVAGRVQYVVTGRAATARTIRRPTAPSIAAMLGQMRPGASAFPPGSIGGPVAPRLPYPIAARPQPVTIVTLEMRIIDAASGQVLRTVTLTRPAAANVAGLVPDTTEVSDALIRAIADLERRQR